MDATVASPSRKPGFLARIPIWVAAFDLDILRRCPSLDWGYATSLGLLFIGVWGYQAGLLALVAHTLFAPDKELHPRLVVGAMFIATLILLLDVHVFLRAGFFSDGIRELARGGLDLGSGIAARLRSSFYLIFRILLAVGFAQLTAIFVSLVIFAPDITSRIYNTYAQANAHLIGPATTRIDSEIQRKLDAVTAEDRQVAASSAQLNTLRQRQVDPAADDPRAQQAQQEVSQLISRKAKADEDVLTLETFASNELSGIKGAGANSGHPGYGPRYKAALEQVGNAKVYAKEIAMQLADARARLDMLRKQAPPEIDAIKQLPAFERALATEEAKLSNLKAELANLTRGRESAIRQAVADAPNHVDVDDGFLARIAVLKHIAQEDTQIALVIALIDLVSFSIELAAVLSKVTSYVPTTYAALLARDAYVGAVRIVEELTAELETIDHRKSKEHEILPPDKRHDERDGFGSSLGPDLFGSVTKPASQPPKRKRGRPPKNPRPATDANGQGHQEPPTGPAGPA